MEIITIKNKEIAEWIGVHHQTITDIKSWRKNLHRKHYKKLRLFYEGKIKAIKNLLKVIHKDEKKN